MRTDSLISEKDRVRQFWEAEPCGSRYLQKRRAPSQEAGEEWNSEDFETHARTRYELEPHIPAFANFNSAQGKKVLEIGVGMGGDYLQWLKAGAHATGVDISPASIERARKRCGFAGYSGIGLRVADAENLPFPDDTFDVVYSYGAMHHSPDTARCIQEAWRVLKVGGEARIMVYHHPSLTGLMLWLRYGVWRGKGLRQSVYDHLESPGTKSYTREEIRLLMGGFRKVETSLVFSPGDLMVHEPSRRFQSRIYRLLWRFYPRWLMKRVAGEWKLFLLVTATKED